VAIDHEGHCFAAAHADRLITLRDGKIVQDGAPGGADDVIELMKQLD